MYNLSLLYGSLIARELVDLLSAEANSGFWETAFHRALTFLHILQTEVLAIFWSELSF